MALCFNNSVAIAIKKPTLMSVFLSLQAGHVISDLTLL